MSCFGKLDVPKGILKFWLLNQGNSILRCSSIKCGAVLYSHCIWLAMLEFHLVKCLSFLVEEQIASTYGGTWWHWVGFSLLFIFSRNCSKVPKVTVCVCLNLLMICAGWCIFRFSRLLHTNMLHQGRVSVQYSYLFSNNVVCAISLQMCYSRLFNNE